MTGDLPVTLFFKKQTNNLAKNKKGFVKQLCRHMPGENLKKVDVTIEITTKEWYSNDNR